MAWLKRDVGPKFALVYMDPPFFTQRDHYMPDPEGDVLAFGDTWPSRGEYLRCLRPRLEEARDLLDARGCLVLHLNSRISHYAKILGDDVFGEACFASEIVWRYRRWPTQTPNFQRVHDVLLRWTRWAVGSPRWNQLYEPLAESTRRVWKGKKQTAVITDEGKRTRSSIAEEESKGVPMGDVWDIGIIAPSSRERTGYPTQKPKALLRRLIESVTEPGDLVLDPYAGSGTTLEVAQELGRNAYGIDSSEVACKVMAKRLNLEWVTI